MQIEQIYTGCLAEAAYYIESNGEAAIIDPLREVEPYIQRADKDGAKIKYIFETHFHADFVSGHKDLAAKTGANIIYGPTQMETGFEKIVAKDGQMFNLGDISIEVLHTPGHTMESSCYLLRDKSGKEIALFTGDTLFIGDVGRPDLAQKVIAELTQEKLASHLYDSLRNKIMPLADDIMVYPAHGAGSACGKKMSKETSDTLGNQKKTNYALQPDLTRADFVKEVLTGLMPPPGYFPQNVLLNIQGYDSIDEVLERGAQAMNPRVFETVANETDAIIIDTRDKDAFRKGFIPGSIFIGLDGNFGPWVGTLIPDVNQKILFVADKGTEEEVVTRLARVGYDHTMGYLSGGLEAWIKDGREVDTIKSIDVHQLELVDRESIVDVRRASEFNSEHILGAINAPLDYINDSMSQLDKGRTYYLHCASGYRSLVFISILRARGFDNLVDVEEGLESVKENSKIKLSDYVCPTTEL
ncbi:MAG: MBL fold metallo-hydrolase [Saprospiraceae bacterium]|nr:MBL fold metallo-hydrolase [Saprospiraceae bacterium]